MAFDDTTGEASGAWVPGRQAATESGLLVYIMVDSVVAPEVTARFRDRGGNVLGLYQEPG